MKEQTNNTYTYVLLLDLLTSLHHYHNHYISLTLLYFLYL